MGNRREKVVKTLTGGVAGLMKKNEIDVLEGFGAVTKEANVTVDGKAIDVGKAVVLACGSVKKPIPGTEFGGRVIGTEEAWALSELPATMVVIGAGASGTEIASAYARLGTQVMLFEGLDRVLPSEDADIPSSPSAASRSRASTCTPRRSFENVKTVGRLPAPTRRRALPRRRVGPRRRRRRHRRR